MTQRPDDDPAIAEVRRLLAEARVTDPMPADVAARLDQVLAELPGQQPPVPQERPRPVQLDDPLDELAPRRRRKTAGWLVAAAAVVAAFVVVPHISLPSSSTSASTAGSSARSLDSSGGRAGPSEAPNANVAPQGRATGQKLRFGRSGRVVVSDRNLSDVAQQLQSRYATGSESSTGAASCAGVPSGLRVVPAEYHHADAALVYRRAEGGSQLVDLYVCGQDQPVRSTRLPAR